MVDKFVAYNSKFVRIKKQQNIMNILMAEYDLSFQHALIDYTSFYYTPLSIIRIKLSKLIIEQ